MAKSVMDVLRERRQRRKHPDPLVQNMLDAGEDPADMRLADDVDERAAAAAAPPGS